MRYQICEASNGTLAQTDSLAEAREIASRYAIADSRWCPRVTIHDTETGFVQVVPSKWSVDHA